ncbi:MAG TPA: alpha/beta hydrolase, partial [Nocardioidaceae bacterium]|nr:alpha/beta hydrolase [Nocardioidaceae bacterium]
MAHDFGGAVTLRAHLLHGSPVASLLLVDVVALRPWGSPFFNLVKDHTDVFARLPEAVHAGALRAYIAGASHRGLTEVQLDELAAPWLTEQGRPAFYRQIAQADERFTDDFAGRL